MSAVTPHAVCLQHLPGSHGFCTARQHRALTEACLTVDVVVAGQPWLFYSRTAQSTDRGLPGGEPLQPGEPPAAGRCPGVPAPASQQTSPATAGCRQQAPHSALAQQHSY